MKKLRIVFHFQKKYNKMQEEIIAPIVAYRNIALPN